MARLTAKERKEIPHSEYLMYPHLPVENEAHWRAARGRIGNYPGQEKKLIAKWERVGRKHGWLKKKPEGEHHQQLSDAAIDYENPNTVLYENDDNYTDYFGANNRWQPLILDLWDGM